MSNKITRQSKPAAEIRGLIEFPVYFNFHYGKIYDAANREVATVKTLASSDDRRRLIGDWIADAMNEASKHPSKSVPG